MSGPTLNPLTFGLRFRRGQLRQLQSMEAHVRQLKADAPNVDLDPSLFAKAAESVEANEPLVVRCSSRDEVEAMAAAFARLGIARPAIDELSGY